MAWHDAILGELSEELGAAPMRLLRAILDAVESGVDPNLGEAPKQAVVDAVAEAEERAPSAENQRTRIVQINRAAKELGIRKYDGVQPIELRSRKHMFEVRFAPMLEAIRARREEGAKAVRSASEDATIDEGEIVEPQLRVDRPHFQIFISHAHEGDAVEKIVKAFGTELQRKLRHLPHKYKDKFSADLWLDHLHMRGPTAFDHQTDAECEKSALAIFLLSDRWHDSGACQREATHFHGDGTDRRYFVAQLTGKRDNGDPHYGEAPCYPSIWNSTLPNLLALWKRPPADRDAFLTRLRDDIVAEIDRRHFPTPPPPGSRPTTARPDLPARKIDGALLANAGRTEFELAIAKDEIENPFLSIQEGGEQVEEGIPLLLDWACDDTAGNRVEALLGSFGSGKTTTCQLLVKALIERRESDPRTPAPIYLDLRRLSEVYGRDGTPPPLAELIRLSLHSDVRDTVEATGLLDYLRHERCVIIFDGLDEIGTRIGVERLASLYRMMLEVVPAEAWQADRKAERADWRACPARILVTCRTHFFRDNLEQESSLRAHDRNDAVRKGAQHEPIVTRYMAPFKPEQIRSLFVKILGEAPGEAAYESIARAGDLADLARKPIMARYIAELAPDLADDAAAGRAINAASIYGHLFRRALGRDADKKPILKILDRQKLLEELAERMWRRREAALAADTLDQWFDDYAERTPGVRIAMGASVDARGLLQTELRNASLLVRENDQEFRFVHTSFQEYFLARRLLDALIEDRLDMADAPAVSRETIGFMLDLVAIDSRWVGLATALDRMLAAGRPMPLRAFAIALRVTTATIDRYQPLPTGADLSGLELKGWESVSESLISVDLRGTNLMHGMFAGTWFDECQFTDANLGNANFDTCRFTRCVGAPLSAGSARLHDCDVDPESAIVLKDVILRDKHRGNTDLAPLPVDVRPRLSGSGLCTSVVYGADGTTILTTSVDGTSRLWDAATGVEVRRFEGHGGLVRSGVFGPDGTTVLTASDDGTSRLWNTATGAEIRRFEGHADAVRSAVYSPDGAMILTASDDGTSRLWEAATGVEVGRFEGYGDAVQSAVYSPDGATILMASGDTIALLCAATGAEVRRVPGRGGEVRSALFGPDGKTILMASDGGAWLWDTATGVEIKRFEGHRGSVRSAVFGPDGTTVLTASDDGTARLWDAATGIETKRFEGQMNGVMSAVYSQDGATILTASDDEIVRVWDAVTGREIMRFEDHGVWVRSAVFSPNGRMILTASDDKGSRLWDAASGAEVNRFEGHTDAVTSAVYSPDGTTILTTSWDLTARLWDAVTGTEIRRFEGHEDWVRSAVYGPGGATILTASWDNTARLWNAATGAEIRRFGDHVNWVMSATFGPGGATILTASWDKTARLWDTATGEEIRCFEGHKKHLWSATFGPDGTMILTASADNTARLWDVATGAEIRCFEGHKSKVNGAVFGRDGATILTSSDDNTARLWDAATGLEIRRFEGHGSRINSAEYSADGAMILTASNDGTARLWDIATGKRLVGLAHLARDWATLDGADYVTACGPQGWRYIHGVEDLGDGRVRVVSPWDYLDAA